VAKSKKKGKKKPGHVEKSLKKPRGNKTLQGIPCRGLPRFLPRATSDEPRGGLGVEREPRKRPKEIKTNRRRKKEGKKTRPVR
jgi:hypothetical protein